MTQQISVVLQTLLLCAQCARPPPRQSPEQRRRARRNALKPAPAHTPILFPAHPPVDALLLLLLLPCLQETRRYVSDVMKTWDKSKTGDLQTDEVQVLFITALFSITQL